MKAKSEFGPAEGKISSPFLSVTEALGMVSDQQWRDLARLAEKLLGRLRQDPRKAAYLAGVTGEDVVGTVVLALQVGTTAEKKGRKVNGDHLQSEAQFMRFLRSAIKSTVDNFRRHRAAQSSHVPITCENNQSDCVLDPADPRSIDREIAMRDLLQIIIHETEKELAKSPHKSAILRGWIDSLYYDEILPTNGHSKFLGHHVRAAIRKQLRQLAKIEAGLEDPSGKELLR